jgi:dTDP-4-dehydrorhamnose 3,5-epimerase
MTIETTPIQDLVIINPTVFEDARGYFFEAYNQNSLAAEGINIHFVQDNQSFSKRGRFALSKSAFCSDEIS